MIINLFYKIKNNSDLRDSIRKPFYYLSLVIILLSWNQPMRVMSPLLQDSTWSPQQTIPGYELSTWPPILIADQNRTVHAFSYQWIQELGQDPIRAIVYNTWTLDNGWTPPVDILISPQYEARLTDVYLDSNGVFHLVFFGGNNTTADIYYSKAPATKAGDASAWSTPLIIGANAGDPEGAAIMEDNQGILHVLFNGQESGTGVYEVTSADNGDTWLNPAPIFFTNDQAPLILGLQITNDDTGELHAIWNTRTTAGQGRGVYYTNLKDGGHWKDPTLIDQALEGYGINYPSIKAYQGLVFVIYLQTPKVMMRLSRDNGETWENPVVLFSRQVGVNGSPSMVVDSSQTLHLFFAQRIDATANSSSIHGMWHSIWKDNRWTEPDSVVKGLPFNDPVGLTSFDPFEAHAVVSQGNVILVTWRTDPGISKKNGVWYSYTSLDTPELPTVPLPDAPSISAPSVPIATEVLPTVSVDPTPNVAATFKAVNVNTNNDIGQNANGSPDIPMIIAFTICLLFLLFIAIRALAVDNHR